jgi:hypothetical protein
MTAPMQAEQAEILARFEKEHDEEFVTSIKKQDIQTVLDFDKDHVEITKHGPKTFVARLRGVIKTSSLHREDAPSVDRQFEAVVTIATCPRTQDIPNGLLVAKFTNQFLTPEKKSSVSDPQPAVGSEHP